MTTVRPLIVWYCFALPLSSRRFCAASLPPAAAAVLEAGMRKTWLARNSSEVMSSFKVEPLSDSRWVRRTSVVGTRRMW